MPLLKIHQELGSLFLLNPPSLLPSRLYTPESQPPSTSRPTPHPQPCPTPTHTYIDPGQNLELGVIRGQQISLAQGGEVSQKE